MVERIDPEGLSLVAGATPPLPPTLERRTLRLARAHLRKDEEPTWALRFADYVPSPALVPALLTSAAVVFAVDAVVALVRLG